MNIGALNEKIVIQRQTSNVDSIGNHMNTWADYFTCFATVSGEESSASGETETAGHIISDGKASFTVRWCSELANINSREYRVRHGALLYDINGINHLNYSKKAIKLMCSQCRR